MDILEVLRTKILMQYPDISAENLAVRLGIAMDMLRLNTFRNYR